MGRRHQNPAQPTAAPVGPAPSPPPTPQPRPDLIDVRIRLLAAAASHVEFVRTFKRPSLPKAIRDYDEIAAKLRKLVTGEDKDVHATAHSVH